MQPISKTTSIYLNCARWCAAFAVVLYHYQDKHFGPEAITRFFPSNGHGYVVVFFVISGFVVSMTAESKTLAEFAVDRAVRIYIVALPVLLIAMALSFWLTSPTDEYQIAVRYPVLTFLLNAAFVGQSWTMSITPFLDGPYWSLCYEVAYYAIFAALWYSSRFRFPLTFLFCLLAGPKILILFPCWLAGVAAYKLRNLDCGTAARWTAFLLSPVVLVLTVHFARDWLNSASDHLGFHGTTSEAFLRSWLVAIGFALHLWGVCRISIPFPPRLASLARQGADMSYSLYLLHLPMLYVLALWLGQKSPLLIWIGAPIVLAGCGVFAHLTEQKRRGVKDFLMRRYCSPPIVGEFDGTALPAKSKNTGTAVPADLP